MLKKLCLKWIVIKNLQFEKHNQLTVSKLYVVCFLFHYLPGITDALIVIKLCLRSNFSNHKNYILILLIIISLLQKNTFNTYLIRTFI